MTDADKDAKTLTQVPEEGPPEEASGESRRERPRESSPSVRDLDFGARYKVKREVGRGGMGEVYRAYDATLTREVALKVVRADRADNVVALERFRREVALASKVTHENVLRVYDLSESGELSFLSMQYVEGRDLAELMRKEGPLALPRALALFRQVCEGLSAAHKQGIVHRDLKPGNVLVDSTDHVYVADFGLARSLEDATLTAEGALLGSPAYMSPEQVKGDPLDARSDIYSLGVILYQLLTGETPFQGGSAHSVMEQRLYKKPAPVRAKNVEVPVHLERVVERCLQVDSTARYASVGELLRALDAPEDAPSRRGGAKVLGLVGGAVALALAIVGVIALRGHHPAEALPQAAPPSASAAVPPTGARQQVLVLGVENRTADPVLDGTLEYVLGMALRRSTVLMVFDGPQERSLATELGADGANEDLGRKLLARDGGRVVTVRGTVASRGAGYALSVEAKDASSGAVVLSRTLDAANPSRVAPTVGALAWSIRSALGEEAPTDASAVEETGASASLEADHEYALGRALVGIGRNAEAVPHLERAVAVDPEFSVAQARLAITLWNEGRKTEAAEHFKVGLEYSARMGEYDRRTLLADYYSLTGESDRAIAENEEMLRTWPGNISVQIDLCDTHIKRGDVAKALVVCQSCAKDHPKDVIARSNEINAILLSEGLDQVRAGAEKFVRDFPHPLWTVYEYQGIAAVLTRRRSEGTDAYEKLRALEPSIAAGALADLAVYEGRLTDAAALLEKGIADDLGAKNADSAKLKWSMVAQLRLRKGDKAGAILAAERAASSTVPATIYSAAQVYVDAGQPKKALPLVAGLDESLSTDARRFARLLKAEGLRAGGKPREAVDVYEEVLKKTDLWLAHFLLARAYLDLGAFTEAWSELKKCMAHRGEGALVFLDDNPSLRFLPLAQYALARAQDGMKSPDAVDAYRAFLALEPDEQGDPMAADARRRLEGR